MPRRVPKTGPITETAGDQRDRVSQEARRRGDKLRQWLAARGLKQSELAVDAGLSEMTISKYVSGATDIARMRPSAITKLLDAMHVSDTYAWELFEIPEELRATWRSLRTNEMGPPTSSEPTMTYVLETPTQGDWQLPSNTVVTVGTVTTGMEDELVLAQLADRYWIAARAHLPAKCQVLGAFKSAAPFAGAKPH